MKKFLKVICCLFIFTLCFSLVGCNSDKDTKNKIFNLTLVVGGETWMEIECDEIDSLPTPSKDYCDFAGWYLNDTKVEYLDLHLDNITEYKFALEAKFKLKSNYQCYKVLSASMSPAINIGEYVLVDSSIENYAVNDIVAYETSKNLLVIHRITAINGDVITTKGDANNAEDNSITKSDIIGKVVYVIGDTIPSDIIA